MNKKILVISDSHGHLGFISDVLRLELDGVQMVVHLGDAWFDMKPFIRMIKDKGKEVLMIRGNVDSMREDSMTPFIPEIEIFDVVDKKVLCTHGHIYDVHNGLDKLKHASLSKGARIVLFGHTHQPMAREINGIFFFNPGPMRDGIYGIISIGQSISHKHYKLKNLP
ncbi:MAG: YfcE family phosphodiesterase [Brevinematales bacterium]|nr:YfcE family phosphodiesterase [Brevinematales bacterium]